MSFQPTRDRLFEKVYMFFQFHYKNNQHQIKLDPSDKVNKMHIPLHTTFYQQTIRKLPDCQFRDNGL